jgi:hypothetical protein
LGADSDVLGTQATDFGKKTIFGKTIIGKNRFFTEVCGLCPHILLGVKRWIDGLSLPFRF